jgi:SM-20-related protein
MSEPIASDVPVLNPAHDRKKLADVFHRFGRLHIPQILTPASAARVHRCLESETPYKVVLNDGENVFDLQSQQFDALTPEQHADLTNLVYNGARRGFQFYYDSHRVSENGEPYFDPTHYHAAIAKFLNGEPFLSFIRTITGIREIAFADAQATRYGPNHFLTVHDDILDAKKRLAAYVLNMTPRWRPDWGGLLLFVDPTDGHVSEGYTPAFNALNILRVPQLHLVSQVTPFAQAHRYSVTGWFRAR